MNNWWTWFLVFDALFTYEASCMQSILINWILAWDACWTEESHRMKWFRFRLFKYILHFVKCGWWIEATFRSGVFKSNRLTWWINQKWREKSTNYLRLTNIMWSDLMNATENNSRILNGWSQRFKFHEIYFWNRIHRYYTLSYAFNALERLKIKTKSFEPLHEDECLYWFYTINCFSIMRIYFSKFARKANKAMPFLLTKSTTYFGRQKITISLKQ